MSKIKRIVLNAAVLGLSLAAMAQGPQQGKGGMAPAPDIRPGSRLTLDDCHRLALQGNKSLRSSEELMYAAEDMKKMSVAEFFPRVSANGAYHWQSRNPQLLSDEQKDHLNNIGTSTMNTVMGSSNLLAGISALMQLYPQLTVLMPDVMSTVNNLTTALNNEGHNVVEALDMDLANLCAGAVTVTQPVYLGGKLRAVHRAASMAYNMASATYDKTEQDKLVEVDKAYWQVISVRHKKELAEHYCRLLERLDSNVQLMVQEEVATQVDATKVRVKLNEAQMSLTKAASGYELAQMLLAQMIGLDMNASYIIVEDTALECYAPLDSIDIEDVIQKRHEMKMLAYADTIAQTSVMLARSALLPNVVVEGSYLTTRPSFFNGYEDKFGGTLAAGIAVNIPIAHPGAIYNYKAAKHRAAAARLQREEMQEMVQLEVNKLNTDLKVSRKKLVQARANLTNAEENLALATESFEAGVISSTELMEAQTAWLQARNEVLDADIETRMNHLYLNKAMGRRK